MLKTTFSIAVTAMLFAGSALAAPLSGIDGSGNVPVPGATATVDFEDRENQTAASFTAGGVTISGIGGDVRIDSFYAGEYNTRGNFYLDNDEGSTRGFRFDFSSTVSAFAFNFGATDDLWTLSAFDSQDNLIESVAASLIFSHNDGNYIGLANAGIAYATFTSAVEDWVLIDNITFASESTNDVPEPASLALLGLGLAAFACSRRKTSA